MNITNQIKYYDKLNDKYYLIPSGIHLLFGEKILEYLEFNQDVFNDINIVYRKNNFIKEVFKYLNANYDKFDSQKNFVKIFYSFINQTNIDFNSFFEIFLDLTEVKTYDILFDKVPGQIELKNDVKGINISVTQAMNILPKNFKTRYSSSPKDNYITVEILNSTSASGLAEKVRQKIQFFADIDVLYTGNANERGLKNTVIKYHNNLRSAQRIKELLGVGKIVRDIDKNSFFDITIILADDIDTEKIKKIED